MFRRCFRMGRSLFLRIVEKVEARDNYFMQRRDSVGRLGLSALQKITAVFRMLEYGCPADATDEYIKIGESTTIESLKRFCRAVVEEFVGEYHRSPNATDVASLLRIGKDRDFPGMLGSLDCMHWKWKNCLTAWTGQYAGRSGSPTIILEAVADYDLWIWHAYFGLPGTNNDINVLEASHLFSNLTQGLGSGEQCAACLRCKGRMSSVKFLNPPIIGTCDLDICHLLVLSENKTPFNTLLGHFSIYVYASAMRSKKERHYKKNALLQQHLDVTKS
ncbi:hypothetical protein Ddye_024610 [Dipteronia dyeriana]|uniref:Uncharacterized protein n=1 Tax=Dipteronia dyeriana TaxID=168575 RepID=A0AAD9TV99_9ROSI|nr:hypothetical protein Ddye_024610 [Dipteronia dyeriana]